MLCAVMDHSLSSLYSIQFYKTYYHLFIHISAGGHLDSFYFWIYELKVKVYPFLLGIHLGLELLSHRCACLALAATAKPLFQIVDPVNIPTRDVGDIWLLHVCQPLSFSLLMFHIHKIIS